MQCGRFGSACIYIASSRVRHCFTVAVHLFLCYPSTQRWYLCAILLLAWGHREHCLPQKYWGCRSATASGRTSHFPFVVKMPGRITCYWRLWENAFQVGPCQRPGLSQKSPAGNFPVWISWQHWMFRASDPAQETRELIKGWMLCGISESKVWAW